jgi:hypothetical protein
MLRVGNLKEDKYIVVSEISGMVILACGKCIEHSNISVI